MVNKQEGPQTTREGTRPESVHPLSAEQLQALDPGIRRTVAWMRAHGFRTTNSGDGKTKLERGCCGALGMPHVAVVLENAARLQMDCEHLAEILRERGIDPQPMALAPGQVEIHGTYDPAQPSDRAAVIVLYGVDDAALFGAEPAGAAL